MCVCVYQLAISGRAQSDRFQKLLYNILCKILQWPTGRTSKRIYTKNMNFYSNRYSEYVFKSGNMLTTSYTYGSIASSIVKSQSPAKLNPLSFSLFLFHPFVASQPPYFGAVSSPTITAVPIISPRFHLRTSAHSKYFSKWPDRRQNDDCRSHHITLSFCIFLIASHSCSIRICEYSLSLYVCVCNTLAKRTHLV